MAILEHLGLGGSHMGPVSTALVVAIGSLIFYQLSTAIYNVFLHPLRKFPGPLFNAASGLPWAYRHATGVQAFHTSNLHEQYGPVVRIGPSHLSFTDPRAWKEIYGHRVGANYTSPEMAKAETFTRSLKSVPTSIINAGREEHARFRKALSHGFSDASMREQEPLIKKYIDLLITRLHQECDKVLNLEAWYNWTTFDVVGDLVFGQSFGCLEGTEYHPWVSFIFKATKFGATAVAVSYVGLGLLIQGVFRLGALGPIHTMRQYTNKLVTSRLNMEKERDDLFEGLVKRKDEWNMSFEKLSANAFILVLAGSETTATTLSGATYLILTSPDVHARLNEEVRSTFKSADEININSVNKLSYMLAVLNESLRLYPPVTSSLVRIVPPEGSTIAGHYVPAGTYVECQHWAMNHSSENWTDPWKFDPNRFLVDSEKASKAGNKLEALQAFSVGPRNCIGRNLAYAEMRMTLARIIFDFDMKLIDDSKAWIERQKAFPLWDRLPLNVKLTPIRKDKS